MVNVCPICPRNMKRYKNFNYQSDRVVPGRTEYKLLLACNTPMHTGHLWGVYGCHGNKGGFLQGVILGITLNLDKRIHVPSPSSKVAAIIPPLLYLPMQWREIQQALPQQCDHLGQPLDPGKRGGEEEFKGSWEEEGRQKPSTDNDQFWQ